jgi:hypothetical protein
VVVEDMGSSFNAFAAGVCLSGTIDAIEKHKPLLAAINATLGVTNLAFWLLA